MRPRDVQNSNPVPPGPHGSPAAPRRAVVAMSGGVDSSVAAALLVEQGWEVVGVHLKLHDTPDSERRDKSCCSIDDALDARQVCAKLGIPFYVLNFIDAFREQVIDYFADSYRQGRTPNPCVMCNRTVKHSLLLEKAREFGCEYLATGHYARVSRKDGTGDWNMIRPRDRHKDQTYFLFGTPREELPFLLYPLAEIAKDETRAIAERHGFITWNKPDSQEVCFVPRDYRKFLADRFGSDLPLPGAFVNATGEVMGEHRGLAFYTIGQRRGLGLSSETPLYVVDMQPRENRIVLGGEEALYASSMKVSQVNWVSRDPITGPIEAVVKVRYAHEGTPARIVPQGEGVAGHSVRVEFDRPVRAITPGQAAAFYEGDILLGGGWIQPEEER